jgi:hypothetical protein
MKVLNAYLSLVSIIKFSVVCSLRFTKCISYDLSQKKIQKNYYDDSLFH